MSTVRKTALITGCTPGGIGHALAMTLSQPPYSYHVFATARTQASLADLASKPNITALEIDVTDSASVERLKHTVSEATGGRLDYLINNAGRNYTVPAIEVDMDEVRLTFETNIISVIALCNAFVPLLVAQAQESNSDKTLGGSALAMIDSLTLGLLHLAPENPRPAIIQLGSIAGVTPYTLGSVYNCTKAALHSYSDTLRLEIEPFGVDVVVLVTGGVKSNIARTERTLRPDSLYAVLEEKYMRRQKHSQEVGISAVLYAHRVVRQFTAWNRKNRIWEGGRVLLAWIGTWMPIWLTRQYMRTEFGLSRLSKVTVRKGK